MWRDNHQQSLIETTPCSLCNGLLEHLETIYIYRNGNLEVPEDTLNQWVPCVCAMPEELNGTVY